ncbi:MAG: 2,3-bisphosphoglycerate-independent phosphoglycerate mutase [Firmicutes bacterium]|nr:2,3-bisphosphoglycerate-independent phosphoglycerate mutase [Bacillota bacterium]
MSKQTHAIIIMDGYANRKHKSGNAVRGAKTPNLDRLIKTYPSTEIEASGRAVGLPEGQIGNSEVGHLNLGAGRIVYQDITRIDKSIEDGDFFDNKAFLGAIDNAKKTGGALHLLGLLSDGGVHSSNKHLYALLELAKKQGLSKVYVHCLMDGRDTPPQSGDGFVAELEAEIKRIGVGTVATVIGRYFFMDRDNNWDRVKIGYDAMFDAVGVEAKSGSDAVAQSYKAGKGDEFVKPTVVDGYKGVKEGDSIIFFNFRADRARQISQAIMYNDFDKFERVGGYRKVSYVGMTQYDASFGDNIVTAYGPRSLDNTLGEYLGNKVLTQARVAETEKYAHVTFFFNGGVEAPNKGEARVLVPSPKVATYDMQPEMSAYAVADKAVAQVGKVDVLIVNFANCDMVGHTGIYEAAIKAVETVDACVGKVVDAVLNNGGSVIITSDHGNAEQMSFEDGSPCTAHTTAPVPLILASNSHKKSKLKKDGKLCDVAPTLLKIMGLEQPKEMDGDSLI